VNFSHLKSVTIADVEGVFLMERTITIHIEKLPEGLYLATSDEVQGLVAQGRTVTETLEIARDVAKKLIEAQSNIRLPEVADHFSYPLVIG
jgi:predicted RNase H-like HicB family nuclease